jgi:hypothetical protein
MPNTETTFIEEAEKAWREEPQNEAAYVKTRELLLRNSPDC